MKLIRQLFAVASFALIVTGSNAYAQSIPPEGPLSVAFSGTQIPPAKPMPIGGGKEFMVINLVMTASNDAGNPILNNMAGRCQMSRTVDPATKTSEQHGFCTYADNDGDQIFEQCDFLPGSPNNCKLTGGTGKFDGLQADIVITAAPVKSNFDGIGPIIMGHKKGTYRYVKATH